MRERLHRRLALPAAGAAIALVAAAAVVPARAESDGGGRMIDGPRTVSVADMLAAGPAGPAVRPASRLAGLLGRLHVASGPAPADAALGGSSAPASAVVNGGGNANGFNGLDIVAQENAGTGAYKGTNGGLEPPDQALCVGSGFVIEGVNDAFQMFTTSAVALTPPIAISQFFRLPAGSTFVSDPRCIYDAPTGRFFLSALEIDEVTVGVFTRSHTELAVSRTSNPTGGWYLYSLDVTDDGAMGTPAHSSCPCIGDQPLIGADANGFYVSDNEYSDAEILPVQTPPAATSTLNTAYATIPGFRNGQAQVYGLSKQKLVNGRAGPVVQFDTATVAVPSSADAGGLWSSLQPAHAPPGDGTVAPATGVEYFLSQLDFHATGDNRVAVWALTNTASLASTPKLSLQHLVIRASGTYTAPVSADQKAGPTPLGATCLPAPCDEEKLAANDDRMNEVMLTNGNLWSGVNTKLPPINANGSGAAADTRTGIMYFDVRPSLVNGRLSATMARDGYVVVPHNNVLFPSIGASPAGPVVMSFTLSGVDHYPSGAWAELDGLAPGQAPTVHVSAAGTAPEDGFTGYCLGGTSPSPATNLGGVCTDGISRWGDYSFSEVDEHGCIWSGTEYIAGGPRDPNAGNWATFITRIAPTGCTEPPLTPKPAANLAPCLPLFTHPAGADDYLGSQTNHAFKGQNPQMNILAGSIRLSPDGKTLVTTLTLRRLSTDQAHPAGQENEYYLVWTFAGTDYYTHVAVGPGGSIAYSDGQINGNTYTDRLSGPTDTGSFRPGPGGTVTVDVPLSQIGGAKPGDVLAAPHGQTFVLAGVLLEPVDAAGPVHDAMVGQTCR